MFDLSGENVLLTGATGGIGLAIAELFAKRGATIVVTGSNLERLQNLHQKIGDAVIPIRCDLRDTGEVDTLYAKAEGLIGGAITILLCNAGITADNLALRMTTDEWQRVIDLNLTTTFKLNQSAIKKMMRSKYGRIVNISSVVACTGNIGQPNYSAAKAGMIAMSKSIALEVASRNITVNCIAPGFIDTPMTAGLNEEIRNTILARIPAKRFGTQEEVASAALFLSARESGYITGSTLHVNGGMYMA